MLAMHHMGRLAFHLNDRVDIEPAQYVWAEGWVYGRTAAGAKLLSLGYSPWVAFECDESDERGNWRAVVVRGSLHVLTRYDEGPLHGEWERAASLLQRYLPDVVDGGDAAPGGSVYFRIHASQVSGQATRP